LADKPTGYNLTHAHPKPHNPTRHQANTLVARTLRRRAHLHTRLKRGRQQTFRSNTTPWHTDLVLIC